MKVLISYSHEDESFVNKLKSSFENSGIEVLDPEARIRPGDNIVAVINHDIDEADLILPIFSQESSSNRITNIELELITSKIVSNSNKRIVPIARGKNVTLPPFINQYQALVLPPSYRDEQNYGLVESLLRNYAVSDSNILSKQNTEAEVDLLSAKNALLNYEKMAYENKRKIEIKAVYSSLLSSIVSAIVSIITVAIIIVTLAKVYKDSSVLPAITVAHANLSTNIIHIIFAILFGVVLGASATFLIFIFKRKQNG